MPTERDLMAPTGAKIIGTHELLVGTALIDRVYRTEHGEVDVDWEGTTEVDWDLQRTARDDNGQKLYVDDQGRMWPENQLVLIPPPEPEPEPELPSPSIVNLSEIDRFG